MSRICIITSPRSGSHWLMRSLEYMHGLNSLGEYFLDISKINLNLDLNLSPDFIKQSMDMPEFNKDNIIFKVFPLTHTGSIHLTPNTISIINLIVDSGAKFVSLERKNIFNKTISFLVRIKLPIPWNINVGNDKEYKKLPRIYISKQEFLEQMSERLNDYICTSRWQDIINIEEQYTYEDMLQAGYVKPIASLPQIENYSDNFHGQAIKSRWNYAELISNYDELIEWRNTYFGIEQ